MYNNFPVIRLHTPTYNELEYRQRWLHDPDMMSYNAGWQIPYPGYDNATGCIDWPEHEWAQFLNDYCSDVAQAGYFYLVQISTDQFVGHAHYRIIDREAQIGINIVPNMRNQGLATLALQLLLQHIESMTQATVAVNEFESSRTGAVRLHRKLGFVPQTSAEKNPSNHPTTGEPIVRWVYQFPQRA
ncbi:GNAT family N-acetyltransferase [Arcanobacterium phocae]|uniref:GNAT family N-acetyltransferase n=1 Tax=Arcanobacterium phocae TaxID=131112 RepID=UPI001C0ED7EF|nr:GNAT family N-acetyltransferase [Arcanobacterium phocae]